MTLAMTEPVENECAEAGMLKSINLFIKDFPVLTCTDLSMYNTVTLDVNFACNGLTFTSK